MKNKFILIFIMFSSIFSLNLFALAKEGDKIVYQFWVDNESMVDIYSDIFNVIAGLFTNGDYMSLLKMVFLLGGIVVFIGGVLKSVQNGDTTVAIKEFTKYMLLGTAILSIMFSMTSKIEIQTRNYTTYCHNSVSTTSTGTYVSGVPTILAWTFEAINKIGTETTTMAKEAFAPVNGVAPSGTSRNDFAYYLQAIGKIQSLTFDDLEGNTNGYNVGMNLGSVLRNIMVDCISMPGSTDSEYGPKLINALRTSGDTFRTMSELFNSSTINIYKNPTCFDSAAWNTETDTNKKQAKKDACYTFDSIPSSAFSGIALKDFTTTLNGETYTCQNAWQKFSAKIEDLKNNGNIECLGSLSEFLNPTTLQVLTGDPSLKTVTHAKSIALNSAMANQLLDSKNDIAMGELSYAAGKSMSEFVTNSLGTGYYMAQMLPYLQMGMRAVLYAFFPFVFVVILLPGGIGVLVSYLQTLIWIELWSPTAAILNMFLSKMSENKFSDMYNSQGYNPLNGVQTMTDAAMLASVGGYLYASVPALTWLILKGSGQMLGSITGSMASGITSNIKSDSINRDLADRKKLSKVNEVRQSRGEKMVSMAEMDKLESTAQGLSEAGEWTANTDHMDDQFMASFGGNAKNIASSTGVGSSYLTNSNAYLAEKSKSKVDTKVTTKTQEDLDNVKNGEENTKQQKQNIEAESNKKATEQKKNMKAVKFQKMIAKSLSHGKEMTLKESQDIIARIQSIAESASTNKEGQYQKLINELDQRYGTGENNTAQSTFTASAVKAVADTFDYKTTEEKFKKTNIVNEKGDPSIGNIQNYSQSQAKVEAADLTAKNNLTKSITQKDLTDSKTNQFVSETGKGSSIPETTKQELEAYVNNADISTKEGAKSVERAEKLISRLENGNSTQRNKALKEATEMLKLNGAYGNMSQNIQSDSEAKALNESNIRKADLGKLNASTIGNRLNTEAEMYRQLSEVGKGNNDIAQKMEEVKQNLYGDIDNKDLKDYQKAAIAEGVMRNEAVDADIYNTVKNNVLVNDLIANGYNAKRTGLSDSWSKKVETTYQEYSKAMHGNQENIAAGLRVAKEFVSVFKMGKGFVTATKGFHSRMKELGLTVDKRVEDMFNLMIRSRR